MPVYSYPSPCAPAYRKPTSVEECLPNARYFTKAEFGRAAMGPVKRGDHILIVTLPDQDKYVQEAVTRALKEEGAEKVDFICEHEISEAELRKFSIADGWREAEIMEKAPWDMSGSSFYTDVAPNLRKYLSKHPEYTSVFWGIGGRGHLRRQLGEHADKFRGNWLFNNWEEFAAKTWTFPDELWIEIERPVIDALGKASAVRITDPEGTFLEYSLTQDDAARWQMRAWLSGHLILDLFHATSQERSTPPVDPEVPPVFHELNGVLAGTANHMGYFPRIELYFEHGRLVEVEGGGRYGSLIKELMDKYQDCHWLSYPNKGFFWFCDCALCTSVKAFRRTSDMFESYWRLPNITERSRAGVFHMGIGSRMHFGGEYINYAKQHHLPTGHIHVHNYFATYEIKLQGTEYWLKLVDKGRLSSLDGPKVKALTIKYGDPTELLSYDWVPPLPGINCEGDYLQDYAPDPVAYLQRCLREKKPI